jgi:hypothetical protein
VIIKISLIFNEKENINSKPQTKPKINKSSLKLNKH